MISDSPAPALPVAQNTTDRVEIAGAPNRVICLG
jgi:hypothetical protein